MHTDAGAAVGRKRRRLTSHTGTTAESETQEVFVLIPRTRARIALSGVLAALGVATLAAVVPMSAGAGARSAVVKLRMTKRGALLVNGSGFTLYMFTSDRRNKDVCQNKRQARLSCTSIWPPDTTGGKPIAGRGVKRSMLGTAALSGGGRQVTYGGHPLYSYTGDSSRGETDYIGMSQFGGHWHGLTAAGKQVK
jgi:predicted lipoprotein with Yx(FWY)xxD motif